MGARRFRNSPRDELATCRAPVFATSPSRRRSLRATRPRCSATSSAPLREHISQLPRRRGDRNASRVKKPARTPSRPERLPLGAALHAPHGHRERDDRICPGLSAAGSRTRARAPGASRSMTVAVGARNERLMMERLEAGPTVRKWTKKHGISIGWTDRRQQRHTYRPDFLVEYTDGTLDDYRGKGWRQGRFRSRAPEAQPGSEDVVPEARDDLPDRGGLTTGHRPTAYAGRPRRRSFPPGVASMNAMISRQWWLT